MSDENTTIDSGVNGRTTYNVVVSAGKTYIINAVTGRTEFIVNGEFTPGGDSAVAVSMTTDERTAITPDAGVLVWDTDLEKLFVGDGETVGGKEIEGGGGVDHGAAIFDENVATLAANTEFVVCSQSENLKNSYIELFCKFSGTFGEVKILHGSAYSRYIKVTSSVIGICDYSTDTLLEQYEHGLTLTDFMHILVYTKNDTSATSSIVLATRGGSYTIGTSAFSSYRGAVRFVATFGVTDVAMRYIVNDAAQPVWVFGDSYADWHLFNTWNKQLINAGHNHILCCCLGGVGTSYIMPSFRNLIALARPKCLFWAIGMNDPDDGAINTTWEAGVEEVIATCKSYGVTPVLCTIPNIPTRDNSYKNAWIKASGKRYADFAAAVSADSSSTWYTGYLSGDGVHPTTLGATALMNRFMTDVPESIYPDGVSGADVIAGYGIDVEAKTVSRKRFDTMESLPTDHTIMAGHGYSFELVSGTTIYAEACPVGKFGLDARVQMSVTDPTYLTLGGIGFTLSGELTSNAVNNCRVLFINGKRVLVVDNAFTDTSYNVTVNAASGAGTLNYAIATSTATSVTFDSSLNGETLDFGGAVNNVNKTLHGNGTTNTILGGTVSVGNGLSLALSDASLSGANVSGCTLSGVDIVGGTSTIGNTIIPSGSTVAVDDGYLVVASGSTVSGGGVLDFNHTNLFALRGNVFHFSGLTVKNTISRYVTAAGNTLYNCEITGGTATGSEGGGGLYVGSNGDCVVTNCYFHDNFAATANSGEAISVRYGGTVSISGCTFTGSSASAVVLRCNDTNSMMTLSGTNVIPTGCTFQSTGIYISDNAILDFRSNSRSSIIHCLSGGLHIGANVTVKPYGGGADVLVNNGTACVCEQLKNDGTVTGIV